MRIAAAVALVLGLGAAPAAAPIAVAAPPRATRAELDAAAAKGVKFLLADQKPDGGWISREYGMDSAGHAVAITAVAMEAVLAGGGGAPDALKAVHEGLAFLEKNARGLDGGKIHHGFDFNGWGAAYGLRHLAGVRDRWPAGSGGAAPKPPDVARLVEVFTGWARKNRRPCGGWTYLTKEQDPRYAKDGSVSFLTGVMIEGLSRWDPRSDLLAAAAEDLSKSCDAGGRALYSHAGDWPAAPRGPEESAGRSLQAALVLAGLGKRGTADVEKGIAAFLAARAEFVKVRTQHPHTPPHMIAGYYYYHAHSYAARALRFLAAREPAPSKAREDRVHELLGALLAEQDADGAWMDAPCGDRAYATSLAVLELLDLRELLFPWCGTLEGAVAAARERGAPVVALFTDGGSDARKLEDMVAGRELEPFRERCLWVRLGRDAEAERKAAKAGKGAALVVLGPATDYDPGRPAQKWGPGVGAGTVRGALEKLLPKPAGK
jgi:hypothetical protein